jgi:hypothetical protein
MALIAASDVKTFLRIAAGTTTWDTLIGVLVTNVVKFIETYLNRSLDETDYIELYSGEGGDRLMLDNYPLVSVSVLSQDIDVDAKTYDDTMDTDDLILHEAGEIESLTEDFGEGKRNIYIEYTAGYGGSGAGAVSYPADLKMVAIEMAAKKFEDSGEKRFGISSKNVMGENIVFSFKDITDQHREILDRYRKPTQIKRGGTVSQYTAE